MVVRTYKSSKNQPKLVMNTAHVECGLVWKVQLFAYYKISRQPGFQAGDTTAPIFYVSSYEGECDGRGKM